MKRAVRAAGYIAIFAAVVATAVIVYVQVGAGTGQNWSSLNDGGPHWPFTLFSVALLTAIASFAVFIGLLIKQGRQNRLQKPIDR
jgi:hypothetical protein